MAKNVFLQDMRNRGFVVDQRCVAITATHADSECQECGGPMQFDPIIGMPRHSDPKSEQFRKLEMFCGDD